MHSNRSSITDTSEIFKSVRSMHSHKDRRSEESIIVLSSPLSPLTNWARYVDVAYKICFPGNCPCEKFFVRLFRRTTSWFFFFLFPCVSLLPSDFFRINDPLSCWTWFETEYKRGRDDLRNNIIMQIDPLTIDSTNAYGNIL